MSHLLHEFDFPLDEVMYLEALANYTKITFDRKQNPLLTPRNIGQYAELLKD